MLNNSMKMDYVLRFSIIFIIFCIHSGVLATSLKSKIRHEKFLQKPFIPLFASDKIWPWSNINQAMKLSKVNSDDIEDSNGDEEQFDDYSQYSIGNTQYLDSDENEVDDTMLSLNKRDYRPKNKYLDLCPMHQKSYKLKNESKQYILRANYTERICNHTTTSVGYNRQYNRVCHLAGKPFGFGGGTHCFQRFTSKDIEMADKFGYTYKYTEEHFRDGCSCGWAMEELGPINGYHLGKVISNLCNSIE